MKIKLISVFAVLLMAMATLCPKNTHAHHEEHKNFFEKSSKASTSSSTCDNNDIASFAAMGKWALYNYLLQVDSWDCFGGKVFTYVEGTTEQLYATNKVDYMADKAKQLADSYNGTNNGIYGVLQYLSIAMTRNAEDGLPISTVSWNRIKSACSKLAARNSIISPSTEDSYLVTGMLYSTCWGGTISSNNNVVSLVMNHLYSMDQYDSWQNAPNDHTYYVSYYYMMDLFFRKAVSHPGFINKLNSYNLISSSLGNIACSEELSVATNDLFHAFPVLAAKTLELIADKASPTLYNNQIEPELLDILACSDYLSGPWIYALDALDANGTYTGYNLNAIRAELDAQEFPNTKVYEDGRLIIHYHSSLPDTEVADLYEAIQQVKAQFFRLFELDESMPVDGDPNEIVQIRIYKDQQSYTDFNSFLYKSISPGGGVYIEDASGLLEDHATIYTWDRDVQNGDSSYELEELGRHEYVHYLQGRYLVKGFWGGQVNDFYKNDRLKWFEEGMAEFLTGSQGTGGVLDRDITKNNIINVDNVPLSSLTSTTEIGVAYNFGPVLWSYWYDSNRARFKELAVFTRQGNAAAIANFDNYIAQINSLDASGYNSQINALKNGTLDTWTPTTESLPYSQMDTGNENVLLNDLVAKVTGLSNYSASVEFTSSLKRFHIQGTFTATNGSTNAQDIGNLYDKLDAILIEIQNESGYNNFDFATAHYTNVQTGNNPSATFHIKGPLSNGSACTPTTPSLSDIAHAPMSAGCNYAYGYCNNHTNDNKEFELTNLTTGAVNSYFSTVHYVSFPNLTPNTSYIYKVRKQCGTSGNYGGWSQYEDFSTPSCSGLAYAGNGTPGEVVAKANSIQNYPNPFTGETTIAFTLEQDVPVNLFVSDATGKQIAALLKDVPTLKGTHQVVFDGNKYPAGIYYYTLQAGTYMATGKMTLID